jgi:hypothetical protein
MEASGSTVLWRLFRAGGGDSGGDNAARSHAVILPGGPPFTLAFFANDEMDRIENYETMEHVPCRRDQARTARRPVEGR